MVMVAFILGLMAGGLVATVVLAALVMGGRNQRPEGAAMPERPVVRHRLASRRNVVPRPRAVAVRAAMPRRLAPHA